ncbi:Sugar transporter ERD6-like 16 [Dissostichus eleginoides]|uniref:Sugar transporter ERD6-like 16 n=1 Tax=Dissostichus eleginoides TaxID=100907 RepID=A0AAD9BG92_DISEL|nr:Sugar transporter ERD6-like 16 [Dissostichus eleginoides]
MRQRDVRDPVSSCAWIHVGALRSEVVSSVSDKEADMARSDDDDQATTQRDALLHPLFSSWVTVGSHITASYADMALRQERKQEMFAIAGLLCTLWEIMGGVQRGRDVPRAMFHISTLNQIRTVWTGSSLSCP